MSQNALLTGSIDSSMACLQVELCVVISEHFEHALLYKGALRMSRFTFYVFIYTKVISVQRWTTTALTHGLGWTVIVHLLLS